MSFENHNWSEKWTKSDLRGSEIQKFFPMDIPPHPPRGCTAVYFSKWNLVFVAEIRCNKNCQKGSRFNQACESICYLNRQTFVSTIYWLNFNTSIPVVSVFCCNGEVVGYRHSCCHCPSLCRSLWSSSELDSDVEDAIYAQIYFDKNEQGKLSTRRLVLYSNQNCYTLRRGNNVPT